MAVWIRSSRFGRCVVLASVLVFLGVLCQFHFWGNDDEGDAVHASVTQPASLSAQYISGVFGADVIQKSDPSGEGQQPNLIWEALNGQSASEEEARLYLLKQMLHYNGGPGDSLLLREVAEEENGGVKSHKNVQKDYVLPPTSYTPSEHLLSVLSEIPNTYLFYSCSALFGTNSPPENKAAWQKSTDYAALDLQMDFFLSVEQRLPDYIGQETAIDVNGFSTDDYGDIVLEDINGIPDLAEILIVQKCLKENLFDIRSRWESFELLFGPAKTTENLPLYNTGLAYCCVGDFGSLWIGTLLLSLATGQPDMDYDKLLLALETTSFLLSASGDIDNDGNTALMEWEAFGAGYDFYEGGYSYYELALFDINQYAYALDDLNAITYTVSDPNVISIYPPSEYVVRGTEIIVNSYFEFDSNDFGGLEPKFDHWHITGETELSPRYSGHEPLVLTVMTDITVELCVKTWDPSTTVSFTDPNLEHAVRQAVGNLDEPLTLGDVCTPSFDTLFARGVNIASLEGLEQCRYLTYINLVYNQITDLSPLGDLYRLLELHYAGNAVIGLEDIANLHDLEKLELGPWIIAPIGLPDFESNNVIIDPSPLANFQKLIVLNLCETTVPPDVLASAPTCIMALLLDETDSIDMTPALQMESLYLLSNMESGLTDADLDALVGISSITLLLLNKNDITSLQAFDQCAGMNTVSVSYNPNFFDIPGYFPNIAYFGANYCNVSDISDLSVCTNVTSIGLDNNLIDDITPLLDVGYSSLETPEVYLQNNTLGDPRSCAVISTLEARGVTVYQNTLECIHTLTYLAGENGSISGPTPQEVSDGGSGLPVTAMAYPGYFFMGWSDGRTDNPRTDVNVTESIEVTATFAPGFPFELSVDAGGAIEVYSSCGTITSTVVGPGVAMWYVPIDCEITLVQYADPGYRFDGWYGTGVFDCNGDMGDVCSFIMTGPATAEAKFLKQHALTLTVVGEGALTATSAIYPDTAWAANAETGPATITVMLDQNTPLHLVADAFPACGFDHWAEANLAGNSSAFDLVLTEDTTITAVFDCAYELNIVIHDEGQGTVTVEENCNNLPPGEPCYDLLLYPCPAEGYRFLRWEDGEGKKLGENTPYNLRLKRDITIHVYFEAQPTLNIEIYGKGLIDDTTAHLLCGDAEFDPKSSPGAFIRHSITPYTYVSTDKSSYAPDSWSIRELEATLGWRFDHWQIYDNTDKKDKKDKEGVISTVEGLPDPQYYSYLGTDIPYEIIQETNATLAAVFVEQHIPTDLQHFIGFLRNEENKNGLDTLDLFASDYWAYIRVLQRCRWGISYNLTAYFTLATFRLTNTQPLTIDNIGQFNLNIEEQGFAIPDIVEVHLIERILDDIYHPLHDSVADAYSQNLTLCMQYNNAVASLIPDFVYPPSGVIHALAAYGTLDPIASFIASSLYSVHLYRLYGIAPPIPIVGFIPVPELAQTADADGDGFSNLDEWLFYDYTEGHPLGDVEDWSNPEYQDIKLISEISSYISSYEMMPTYEPNSSDPSVPPVVAITLETEGYGKIAPFKGTRYLPKYVLTDWYEWFEHDIGGDAEDYCSINVLENVSALPEDDWEFSHWDIQEGCVEDIAEENQIEIDSSLTIQLPSIQLPLTCDTSLLSVFDCVEVPSLKGVTVPEAEAMLSVNNNVKIGDITEEFDYDVPSEYIYDQMPPAGTIIADGEVMTVDLVVSKGPEPRVVASFNSDYDYGIAPIHIQFWDTSTPTVNPVEQWLWNFGDGTESTEQHPQHTYTEPGAYDVSLTVNTSGLETDTISIENAIVVLTADCADIGTNGGTITLSSGASYTVELGMFNKDLNVCVSDTTDSCIRQYLDSEIPYLGAVTISVDNDGTAISEDYLATIIIPLQEQLTSGEKLDVYLRGDSFGQWKISEATAIVNEDENTATLVTNEIGTFLVRVTDEYSVPSIAFTLATEKNKTDEEVPRFPASLNEVHNGGDGPIPLVLIHGQNSYKRGNYGYWDNFIKWAKGPGASQMSQFKLYWFYHHTDYPIGFNEGQTDADAFRLDGRTSALEFDRCLRVARDLRGFPPRTQPFCILAHSRGGLVARTWMQNFPDASDQVTAVLTLATPHHGSCFATIDWGFHYIRHKYGLLPTTTNIVQSFLIDLLVEDSGWNKPGPADLAWDNVDYFSNGYIHGYGIPYESFILNTPIGETYFHIVSANDAGWPFNREGFQEDDYDLHLPELYMTPNGRGYTLWDMNTDNTAHLFYDKAILYAGYSSRPTASYDELARAEEERLGHLSGNKYQLICSCKTMKEYDSRALDIEGPTYAANDGLVALQSALALGATIYESIYETVPVFGSRKVKMPLELTDFTSRLPVPPDRVRYEEFVDYDHDNMVIAKRWFEADNPNYIYECIAADLNKALPPLEVTPETLEINCYELQAEFNIYTSESWKIECDVDWIELSQKEGLGNAKVEITINGSNTMGTVREADINIIGIGAWPNRVVKLIHGVGLCIKTTQNSKTYYAPNYENVTVPIVDVSWNSQVCSTYTSNSDPDCYTQEVYYKDDSVNPPIIGGFLGYRHKCNFRSLPWTEYAVHEPSLNSIYDLRNTPWKAINSETQYWEIALYGTNINSINMYTERQSIIERMPEDYNGDIVEDSYSHDWPPPYSSLGDYTVAIIGAYGFVKYDFTGNITGNITGHQIKCTRFPVPIPINVSYSYIPEMDITTVSVSSDITSLTYEYFWRRPTAPSAVLHRPITVCPYSTSTSGAEPKLLTATHTEPYLFMPIVEGPRLPAIGEFVYNYDWSMIEAHRNIEIAIAFIYE